MDKELRKIDPKCWECGILVIPEKVAYSPLRCDDCQDKKISRSME